MSGMFQEILAFVLTTSGWILESSTVSMDHWKVSSNDGSVITTSTFWANLWKQCVTDSTGISNCRDFQSMLALDGYIQACRGLMIAATCLGLFGSVCALVGMKCTKIGGSNKNTARITCFAGVDFIVCGLCSLSACSLYAHRITTEFFDPMFMSQKYELGAALFIGWAGGILCILGGSVFCFSVTDSFSRRVAMKKRLIQIFGFLISSLGWLFILCTMAMDYWRVSQIGGQGGSFVISVAWYWSNLWKDCFTDSTAVTNCRDYGVLWSVVYYVQAVRGLLMCGLTIGFFAVTCCFVGMECTYIGGTEPTKDKLVFSGTVFHFVGGVSNLAAYCLYINRVARSGFASNLPAGELRYYLGPPIFLGLVGCFLIFFGAVLYAATVIGVIRPNRKAIHVYGGPTYMPPAYRGRSLYTGYYEPSRLYGSYASGRSSSKVSRLSQATPRLSERDAFV